MSSNDQTKVEVQQCLFGYKDGHQLIASSANLRPKDLSALLRLSDHASGVSFHSTSSYWTGIPLLEENTFALMQTWAAPEMPRPGCVWTHALFVRFSDFARFSSLEALIPYFVRPSAVGRYTQYTNSLSIDPTPQNIDFSLLDREHIRKVIRSLYIETSESYAVSVSGQLDAAVFRVWSQQWPRLRRSFSFRTAGSIPRGGPGAHYYFDFQAITESNAYIPYQAKPTDRKGNWEDAVIDDALSEKPTELRRFLWRYGADIHSGIERFSLLMHIFMAVRSGLNTATEQKKLLLEILSTIPDPDEAGVLKRDLLSVDRDAYALLPSVDPLAALSFVVDYPQWESVLAVSDLVDFIKNFWPDKSREVLTIAERMLPASSSMQTALLAAIAEILEPQNFVESTTGLPRLRHELVSEKPELLDTEGLTSIAADELQRLLELVPADASFIGMIVVRILAISDPIIVDNMYARFPSLVIESILSTLQENPNLESAHIDSVWMRAITRAPEAIIRGGYLRKTNTTNTLSVIAMCFGWNNQDVIDCGPGQWASAITSAQDDVTGDSRMNLMAFLLILSLSSPNRGCEPLFEYAFSTVHQNLATESLPYEASRSLHEILPKVSWWKQWDSCYRLRLAVAQAYVSGSLRPASFKKLARYSKLSGSLADLAWSSKAAKKYMKKSNL